MIYYYDTISMGMMSSDHMSSVVQSEASHLALVQNDDARVLVVLLLHSVFGVEARPLHLRSSVRLESR